MPNTVRSQFSISSPQLDADCFRDVFPWRVLDAKSATEQFPQHITVFDLGIGKHERVDAHLSAVRHELLARANDLDPFTGDCHFALWVYYDFPAAEGAFNLHPSIHAAFAMFRVEVIFHLKPIP